MSFSLQQLIDKKEVYPTLGISMPVAQVSVKVCFQALSLLSLVEQQATVLFHTFIEGCSSPGEYSYTFTYSGAGNPLDEAETALRESLLSAD